MHDYKSPTIPFNLGLFLSSEQDFPNVCDRLEMEANGEATMLLKNLLERFNSLEREVKTLKEKEACLECERERI